jgi:hypothetical protein
MSIKENLEKIKENIQSACKKVGRKSEEVTLIAVSKTKPNEAILETYDAGIVDFGENKIQELRDKIEQIQLPIKWHMIGHLQRNKVKYIVENIELIHSVDSYRLAEKIHEEGLKHNKKVQVLIQVNVANEDSKFGIQANELESLLRKISTLNYIQVKGLMTIAPYTSEPEENRSYFRKMKELYVDITTKNIDNVTMEILSMGMTNDYEVAIEEGATMVRVGTGIFGERNYIRGGI